MNTKQKPWRRLDHRRLLHKINVFICSAVYVAINLPTFNEHIKCPKHKIHTMVQHRLSAAGDVDLSSVAEIIVHTI